MTNCKNAKKLQKEKKMIEFYCKSIYSRWHNCPATVLEVFAMEEYYLMWLARMTIHNVQKAFLLLKHFQTAEAVFLRLHKKFMQF